MLQCFSAAAAAVMLHAAVCCGVTLDALAPGDWLSALCCEYVCLLLSCTATQVTSSFTAKLAGWHKDLDTQAVA